MSHSQAQLDYLLIDAARVADIGALRSLLARGANPLDPMGMGPFRRTALMMAAWSGNGEAVELLLSVSDLAAADATGWSAADWARSRSHEALALRIERGIEIQKDKADLASACPSPEGAASRALRI